MEEGGERGGGARGEARERGGGDRDGGGGVFWGGAFSPAGQRRGWGGVLRWGAGAVLGFISALSFSREAGASFSRAWDNRDRPRPDRRPAGAHDRTASGATAHAAFNFGFSQPRLTITSAICTALSAAPLRRLSETHPDVEAVVDRRILADARDVGRVLAGRLVRRDVAARLAPVDDQAARRLAQDFARLVGADRILELDVDRLRMADEHRHAHAGRRQLDLRDRGSSSSRRPSSTLPWSSRRP